jgi:chloramphenicol O-acetyltransferase type A
MPRYLDLTTWSRRDVFEFFRTFDKPYFNICTRLDVTNLLNHLRQGPKRSVSLAYHYFALRIANELEPFRYRLRGDQVLIHDVIHGGTTVLLPNESFILVYFNYDDDFDLFMAGAMKSVSEGLSGEGLFRPLREHDARIHFTTVPWIAFTSFSHARNWGREDSVPKIALGKFTEENGCTWLPFSVEVHHSLVDGYHVGQYLTRLQDALSKPEQYISQNRRNET